MLLIMAVRCGTNSKSDIGVVNIGVHLLDEKNNMLSLG